MRGEENKTMTKTIWMITDETDNIKTGLVYYHFSKEPKFPTWYMEEGHIYSIKMLWNIKLINSLSVFFKCLVHRYIIE